MTIKAWNALLVLALLIVLSGGGYILYQNHMKTQAEMAEQQAEEARLEKEAAEKKAAEDAKLKQEFEDLLNGFLDSVYTQMREYKSARAVLGELMKPENLSSPEYIAENAVLAESTVMSLQLQADDVMRSFERANEQFKELVQRFDEEEREPVQEEWDEIMDTRVEQFTAFFTMDQDVLMAQLELMEFYDAHKDTITVDEENGHMIMETPELQEEEALLRGEIMEMKAMQKDVLQKADETQDD